MPLSFTLRGDGPSDIMLLPILRWVLNQQLPQVEIRPQFADPREFRHVRKNTLAHTLRQALQLHPCDLLFVHRDAENQSPDQREDEIAVAIKELTDLELPYKIAVIPVRMSETWLLIDKSALRRAAGNPNGTADIDLPPVRKLESVADPKEKLHSTLRDASGLKGRKLKSFRPESRVRLLSDLIEDYSPLLQLPAFVRVWQKIAEFRSTYRPE